MIETAVQNDIPRGLFYQRTVKLGWFQEKAATMPVAKKRTGAEEFAVYKGEDFICIGTLQECADHMGVLVETVRFYTTDTYRRRVAKRKNARNYITVTELEDDK